MGAGEEEEEDTFAGATLKRDLPALSTHRGGGSGWYHAPVENGER